MLRNTILQFDIYSIKKSDLNSFINNCNLKKIDSRRYWFEFNDTEFYHATLLLGKNPNRFGYDLQHYLNGIRYSIRKLSPTKHLVIDIGTPDFKRRASEDFGVGLASLIMVKSFNIKWDQISQIIKTRRSTKPDFIAYKKPAPQ